MSRWNCLLVLLLLLVALLVGSAWLYVWAEDLIIDWLFRKG